MIDKLYQIITESEKKIPFLLFNTTPCVVQVGDHIGHAYQPRPSMNQLLYCACFSNMCLSTNLVGVNAVEIEVLCKGDSGQNEAEQRHPSNGVKLQ